jgi:quinol monooxygenase YgiN
MSSFVVIATLTVKDDTQSKFENAFKGLVEKTRANEPGCKLYTFTKKSDNVYVAVEIYESEEAFALHMGSEYLKAVGPTMQECLAGAPGFDKLPILF